MKSREPSEVIQLRSAPAVSMICDLQPAGMLGAESVNPVQVIAETPSWKVVSVGGVIKIKVVAWSVPVEARSTSASPPPKTCRWPVICNAESTSPRNVAVPPNGADQRCVTKCSQDSATIPSVPSARMRNSGSLLPSGRNSAVLVKFRLPVELFANTTTAATHTTITIATSNLRILPFLMGVASFKLVPCDKVSVQNIAGYAAAFISMGSERFLKTAVRRSLDSSLGCNWRETGDMRSDC